MTEQAIDFSALEKQLPPIISRDRVTELFGGIITSKTLANLDSLGEGPPRIRVGRKIGYLTPVFLGWLANRTVVVE